MKIDPSHSDLLELINEVDQLLSMKSLSQAAISICACRLLWQWSQVYDVEGLDRYGQCMLESFGIAAARGISGLPCEVDRSIRSLQSNVWYYRPKIDELLKSQRVTADLAPACAA